MVSAKKRRATEWSRTASLLVGPVLRTPAAAPGDLSGTKGKGTNSVKTPREEEEEGEEEEEEIEER